MMHNPLMKQQRRRLVFLLATATMTIVALAVAGVAAERTARTPLVSIGQSAPEFSLPATDGAAVSLAAQRGHPVVMVFISSVLCDMCREQLGAIEGAFPTLRAGDVAVFGVSVDEQPLQRSAVTNLHLSYPLLSEAPTRGEHPVGSSYGLYHYPQTNPGPVDTNAIVVIDSQGIVRAVRVQPDRPISTGDVLALAGAVTATRDGAQ